MRIETDSIKPDAAGSREKNHRRLTIQLSPHSPTLSIPRRQCLDSVLAPYTALTPATSPTDRAPAPAAKSLTAIARNNQHPIHRTLPPACPRAPTASPASSVSSSPASSCRLRRSQVPSPRSHAAMPLPCRDGAQSPCRVSPPANSYIRGQLPSATDCATVWQHAGAASPGMHTGGYFGYQTASLDPGHC